MTIFVSSTCYDLIDLRDELRNDLRDLGVRYMFSEYGDSDFLVETAPETNSIETCLTNLRASDLVIVVLSQRYGPRLKAPFESISATHTEYREAVKLRKPIRFYVRNRLEADHASWAANGKVINFKGVWAKNQDAEGLFALLEEHKRLVDQDGSANRNNWYNTFISSVDLRGMIRKDIAPRAFRSTAQKLIENGNVPILIVATQGLQTVGAGSPSGTSLRFDLGLLNAGSIPAFNIRAMLKFENGDLRGDGRVAAVLASTDESPKIARNACIEMPTKDFLSSISPDAQSGKPFQITVRFDYMIPTGHLLTDETTLCCVCANGTVNFAGNPLYCGKFIGGMVNYLTREMIGTS
ncbi:DUF4062 domain-containing protein [Zavarzinella formosa]|uniref:DUF4062 domain-containing protein n=1 Tax=Zavarzinella formosa TaxID=360055 RepID=UPI0002F2D5C5|nr:DUF4062 domain-containing protein [Zavarzinella formosa]